MHRVKTVNGRGNFPGSTVTLHRHRPDQYVAGKTVVQAVKNIPDDRAGRRCNDSNHLGKKRQILLALRIEEPLGTEFLAAVLQQFQKRAFTRQFDRIHDDLIPGAFGIGRHLAGDDDLHTFFKTQRQLVRRAPPGNGVHRRIRIFQREIEMARSMVVGAPDFSPNPHTAKCTLERSFDRLGNLRNGEFADIVVGRGLRAVLEELIRHDDSHSMSSDESHANGIV